MAGMDDEMLQVLFEQLDLDGDGVLNKSDLKVALANAGVMISADQVMEKLNKNGTGFISYEEFVDGAALFVGNAADENSNAGDGNSDADAEFRSVFEFCDKDNDGKLSVAELEQAISHCIGRVLTTTEKTEVLKAFGGDKKVFILPDQFVKMMHMWTGGDDDQEEDGSEDGFLDEDDENDLRVFDNYDSDSDGNQDSSELKAELASLREELRGTKRSADTVKKTNAKLKDAVRTESQRCAQLQEALERSKHRNARVKEQMDKLTTDQASDKAETARLQRSLSVLESEQGDWVDERKRMQAELATARAKQQELTNRLHEEFSQETAAVNRLKKKLRSWETRSKKWSQDYEKVQNDLKSLQSTLDSVEQAKAKSDNACAKLESEKRKMKAELEEAKAKAAQHQKQLKESLSRSRLSSSPTFDMTPMSPTFATLLGEVSGQSESEDEDLQNSLARMGELGGNNNSLAGELGGGGGDDSLAGELGGGGGDNSLAAELGGGGDDNSLAAELGGGGGDDSLAGELGAATTGGGGLSSLEAELAFASTAAAAAATTTETSTADTTTDTTTLASTPEGEGGAQLRQELDDMVQAHAELSARAEAMRMEVEDLNEEKTKLVDEKKEALEAKASAEARLKEAEDNNATLDDEINAAVQRRQTLSAENKRLMDENVELTNQQTAQRDKLHDLSGTNRRLDSDLKAKDVEIASCRQTIEQLESTIKEMAEAAEAKGQRAMAEAAEATAAVLTEAEPTPTPEAPEAKKDTETDTQIETKVELDTVPRPLKIAKAKLNLSKLTGSSNFDTPPATPGDPALALEWIQGTKNGHKTWMNIRTGEVTAAPPDVLANDVLATESLRSPQPQRVRAASLPKPRDGSSTTTSTTTTSTTTSSSKGASAVDRDPISPTSGLPEWAKAAPDIDYSTVIEENFTDGETVVPANSVDLVSVVVKKDDDFVWDVSCRGKLRFHVLLHPSGTDSTAASAADKSAASAGPQKSGANSPGVWVLHEGGARGDRNKGRVRVRAKGLVSLVLDNLGQKRKARVRYMVEVDHISMNRDLETVAEIAAEKLRNGEYTQQEYDAIMKAEQSYRREKMSASPHNRRMTAGIEDLALQQLLEGIITQKEYNDIVQRDRVFRMRERIVKEQIYKPDMNKFLGRKGAKLQRRRRALKRRARRAEESGSKKGAPGVGLASAFADERRRYQLFHVEESLNLVTTCKCACNYWEGDYLVPPARKNAALKQAIDRAGGEPNEVILFASVVKRILPERFLGIGRPGNRALVITSSALYELKSPTSVDILHRIELSSIKCVSLSTFVNSAFALIVPDKFDFLFDTPRRAEIVGRLMELYEAVEWKPIRIDFMHSIPLSIENGKHKSAVFDEIKGVVKLIDQ